MLKSHIYIYVEFQYLCPNYNIYAQIAIYIYIYPDCNICIQMVIYMSKMSIDMYPNAVSFSNSSMYICHAIFDIKIFSCKYYM